MQVLPLQQHELHPRLAPLQLVEQDATDDPGEGRAAALLVLAIEVGASGRAETALGLLESLVARRRRVALAAEALRAVSLELLHLTEFHGREQLLVVLAKR